MFHKAFAIAGCLALMAAVASSAQAQDKPKLDPQAARVLKKMSAYLGSVKSFSVTVRTSFDILGKTGIKSLKIMEQKLTIRRPNAIHVRLRNEAGAKREVWFDGKTFAVLRVDQGVYDSITPKGVATLDQLIAYIETNFGVTFPVSDFIRSDTEAMLTRDLISGVYVGKRTLLDGTKTHYLSFESQDSDWQLWVRAGKRPLPMRLVVSYVTVAERPGFIATLRDWKINQPIAGGRFTASMPAGAKRKAFLKKKAGK